MQRVTSTIVAISSVALLWTRLSSPAASAPTAAGAALPESSGDQVSPAVAEVDLEVSRLRERLAVPVGFPEPVRDPFRFGGLREPDRSAPAPVASIAPEPVMPATPTLPKLVAVLVTPIDGGVTRTAVLSVGDGVEVVAVGDVVMGLRVDAISDDNVALSDRGSGSAYRLSLQ